MPPANAPLPMHRDPPMAAQTYQYLCRLIHRHSRIHLGPNKVTLLTSRLAKRRRELGLGTWEEYVDWLEQHRTEEIETLIDLVSTNHTHFFREGVHFEILKSELLERLLNHSPTAHNGLRCWSAACSSGEEAFSLAIVLNEFAEAQHPGLRWQIEATDISNRALYKAKQAVYEIERLGLPDPSYLRKYFQKGSGPYEGFCKVKNDLQKHWLEKHHIDRWQEICKIDPRYQWKGWKKSEIIEQLSAKGITPVAARTFAEGLSSFVTFANQLKGLVKIVQPTKVKTKGSRLKGKTVVFTGFRNTDLEQLVAEQAGTYKTALPATGGPSVILVLKDQSAMTGTKAQKAKQTGVKIITRQQLEKLLGL
jgi:chemotaxis protein methyltransferase CheR